MRDSVIRRFLTNNHRYTPEHPEFRRVYLLNIIMLLFIAVMLIYAVLNLFVDCTPGVVINAAVALLCLAALVFFHKTDKVEAGSLIVVGLVFCGLAGTLLLNGNRHYLLVWTSVFPVVTVFLTSRKKAVWLVAAFIAVLAAYLIVYYPAWIEIPVLYNTQSVANIIGTVAALTLLSWYYDLSRRDAVADALSKNARLEDANRALEENKDRLRLILDSTAEAIFGLDVEGRITFCNTSCLELLGFDSEEELIGRDSHGLIHNRYRDGSPMPRHECAILRTCIEGTATHVDDDVFWRGDASFDVEYHSYPQYRDGTLVGAVVTFTDNTVRKIQAEQIEYYSSHDSLTGLLNRSYFEKLLLRTDNVNNLPLSVVMGDLNGLKLTNDVFGHSAGDELLVKAAEILKKACREGDIVARIGGDEFVILLPRTPGDVAQTIIRRIQDMLGKEKGNVIRCSMSLGCNTKNDPSDAIDLVMKNAEDSMYQDKSRNRNRVDADMINAIIMTMYSKFPHEEQHSLNVSELSRTMGEALNLSQMEIIQLRRAGLLHDIGKVTVDSESGNEQPDLYVDDNFAGRQHPAVGFRILNLFDSTVNIAEAVNSHHEHWDGTGYPRGLKGEEIPLIARIIAVAGRYDHLRNALGDAPDAREAVFAALRREAGTCFDPQLVETLIDVVKRQDA